MRLLIVTFDPPENVGGVEGRAGAYTRELIKANHFVELIALASGYSFSAVEFRGATLHRYPSSLREAPRVFRLAVGEVNKQSMDSLFLLSGALTLFGAMMLSYARLTRRKSATFVYGKDILGAKRSPIQRLLFLATSLLAGRVAVNSKFTSSLLPRFLSSKVCVLYPGVDPDISKDAVRPMEGQTKRILFVGRLVQRKGADDLIRAFGALAKDLPQIELQIVGDGPEMGRLRALAAELGLTEKVTFFGTLTGRALYARYASADVLAMPSKTEKDDVEGFGTVFLEAAAFGVPSVGTASGGIPEAIVNRKTGLIVPERDPDGLKSALAELLTSDEERQTMGRNARETVSSAFTWEAGTRSLVQLFDNRPNEK